MPKETSAQATKDAESKAEAEHNGEEETKGDADRAAARRQRLQNLQSRMNQARNLNKEAALDEYRRRTEGEAAVEAKKRKEAWLERKKQHEKDVADGVAGDVDPQMGMTAAQADEQAKKKRKKDSNAAGFGWEMFNIDTQAKTQKKRLERIHDSFGGELQEKYEQDKKAYEADPTKKDDLEYCIVDEPTEDMRMRLKAELAVTESRRGQFSRRRAFNADADVDYINDRNKKFNEKLKRHFDPFTTEIRQNIERGTAM
ncbi:Pre-mRNA-splicing factor Syf2 [Diplonema papillatum]|nr:Pre-mRNA-splicing factor Syf2 [Diplonema papillatum]WGM49996.1 SYF2 [Diplonema papillatum]